jgi:hypothetical protein
MTHHLKSLIHQRWKALANGQDLLFKSLRNRVNRERKLSRSKFFDTKVKELKSSNPKLWWKSVKTLCGMVPLARSNDFRHLLNPPFRRRRRRNISFKSCQYHQSNFSVTHECACVRFGPFVPDCPTCYESFRNTGQPSSVFVVTEQLTFEKLSNWKRTPISWLCQFARF